MSCHDYILSGSGCRACLNILCCDVHCLCRKHVAGLSDWTYTMLDGKQRHSLKEIVQSEDMLGLFSCLNVYMCKCNMQMLMLNHTQVSDYAHIHRQIAWDWKHYLQQVASTNLGLSSMFHRMCHIQVCRSSFADQGLQLQAFRSKSSFSNSGLDSRFQIQANCSRQPMRDQVCPAKISACVGQNR